MLFRSAASSGKRAESRVVLAQWREIDAAPTQRHFGRYLDGPHAQQCGSGVSAHSGSRCSEHTRAKRERAREKTQARGRRRKKRRWTLPDGPRSPVSASNPMTFCVRLSLLQKSLSLVSPVLNRKNYLQINFGMALSHSVREPILVTRMFSFKKKIYV